MIAQRKKESKNNTKDNWKKRSEEFRSMLKGTATKTNGFPNNDVVADKKGQVVNEPTPSFSSSNLDHCSLCNRKYNTDAYKKKAFTNL